MQIFMRCIVAIVHECGNVIGDMMGRAPVNSAAYFVCGESLLPSKDVATFLMQ